MGRYAQVGFDDQRVAGHVVRLAFRDLLARVDDQDSVGDAEDRLNQMLNHDDGHTTRPDGPDRLDRRQNLRWVETGQKLVE